MDPSMFKFVKDGDKYSVLIDNVRPGDGGVYVCTAINSAGKGEKSITLNVKREYDDWK